MGTEGIMNPAPLNTTDYPVALTTPGSDLSTMLMVLQILFRTKKFQQPQHNLEIKPNVTWSQSNFTTDGHPNPKESKTTHEEDNDVSKIIAKREIDESLTVDDDDNISSRYGERHYKDPQPETHTEFNRLAAEIERLQTITQEYQKQTSDLEIQNKEQDEEIKRLRRQLNEMIAEEENSCNSIRNLHPLPVVTRPGMWQSVSLNDNFGPGSKIVIRGRAGQNGNKMTFNLLYSDTIPFHFDNRWDYAVSQNQLVFNTFTGTWGPEVIIKPAEIHQGAQFVVSIQCLQNEFKICINDAFFATYTHRISPSLINRFTIRNAAEITSIHYRGST